MENKIINIIKFLGFISISIGSMILINWLIFSSLIFLVGLGKDWFLIIFVIMGGIIWRLFKMIAVGLVMLLSYFFSIYKSIGYKTFTWIAFLNGIYLITMIWNSGDFDSTGQIFGGLILTGLAVELTIAIIITTVSIRHDKFMEDEYLE